MVKFGRYAAVSAVSASAVIFHAFKSREQFYPAMLYLATSKISLVLLLNMALVVICAIWQLIKGIFLGPLREVEVERLNEQLWREVMEILFAMTVFRDEFNVSFVTTIIVLLFIKAFHWLAQTRVEYIETTPSVSRLSHVRIISFMALLLILDCVLFNHSFSNLLKTRQPSVSLFFAFEYVILATSTMATFVKYSLYLGDLFMEGQWDNKAVYVFYLELVRDLLHLSLYLFFFLVIFINYGLPLHLVRELYETFRNFKTRVADFIRYRNITSNMNDRFPDATPEELGRSDATCIICREEMSTAKKLPCGHLFHIHCLRSWLERQQTCPTCRSSVLASEVTSTAGDPAAPHPPLQVEEHALQGQGHVGQTVVTQLNRQIPGHGPGGPSVQQERLYNAATSAASQYQSSFVYPTMRTDITNWYPAYVAFVPPAYFCAIPTGNANAVSGNGIGSELQSGGDLGSNGEINGTAPSLSSQAHLLQTMTQMRSVIGSSAFSGHPNTTGSLYTANWPGYGYAPAFGQGLQPMGSPQSSQAAQPHMGGTDSSFSGANFNTGSISALPLSVQQDQLKCLIEVFEKQLQSVIELQNQLSSVQQETTVTSSSSANFQGESLDEKSGY